MEAQQKVTIKSITRKVSQVGNVYCEIDILEPIKIEGEEEAIPPREWTKLFYNATIPEQERAELINKETVVTIQFYPVKRTVGDNVYTNINCHISHIEHI